MVLISDHAGTQIDGLCHATSGSDDHWYNGYSSATSRGDFGARAASAGGMPPIVLTAVLIDVATQLGMDCLDAGFPIDVALLEATLDAQGTVIAPGNAVFIRTGTTPSLGREPGATTRRSPGPTRRA